MADGIRSVKATCRNSPRGPKLRVDLMEFKPECDDRGNYHVLRDGITADSATACPISAHLSATELIHSPPDL